LELIPKVVTNKSALANVCHGCGVILMLSKELEDKDRGLLGRRKGKEMGE
jgi:hypothetical protein